MRNPSDLIQRTKTFAVDVVRVTQELPRTRSGATLGDQLLRCGTSVGANYRAARRARSRREFIAKLGIVEEEADEAIFWLDLLSESGMLSAERVTPLRREANELLSIVIASIRTARLARPSVPHSAFRVPRSPVRNPQ
ncbi:MAG TPA: four helix bundle protein [Gemmatimonadales bacterium]|nr:four helix bundle protein [Gemmatimonadales bacterium]